MQNASKLLLLLILLMQLVGCKGCTQTAPPKTQAELDKEKEEAKKKQRILANDVRPMPQGAELFGATDEANFVKPGHWYQANVKMKANLEDESLTASLTIRNREGTKVPFGMGQSNIEFNRNLSLAKGQDKNIRMIFFQPEVAVSSGEPSDEKVTSQAMLTLSQRTVGTTLNERLTSGKTLSGYQYNLVTISRDPARYAFWKNLDCIVWNSKTRFSNERIAPHLVVGLDEDQISSQLPDKLYAMTSISHIVLNDATLSVMSPEQQKAVLDWLFFGGTIVLNGPDCIAGVETSFLKEYSPLKNTSSGQLSDDDIALLNARWSIKQALGERVLFSPASPIPILKGELNDGAVWVPYAQGSDVGNLEGLVADKYVGQGRIVMTTFPMADIAFTRWPSYSSFIHNAILRKPHRDVTTGELADTKFAGRLQNSEQNPVHSTRLRFWARDLDGTTSSVKPASVESDKASDLTVSEPTVSEAKRTSLGAWNPESLVLKSSRTVLQESSGISVPKISTIIRLLIGYLVVLVPLNWIVFRLFGRVELAWVAAPFIAIAGAFVVARYVQLDVGFSRSQTTQGFLECHADHPRGVLSKYTALYTSLSTSYSALYEDETGVVLPLATSAAFANTRRQKSQLNELEYWFASESGAGLRNFSILSNTTNMLQSEETLDLQGSVGAEISDDNSSVFLTNNYAFPIRDAGIFGRNDSGALFTGWMGTCEPNSKKEAKMEISNEQKIWRKEWDDSPALAWPNLLRVDDTLWTDQNLKDELFLGHITSGLLQAYPLAKGEIIAVGWSDQTLGALKIQPEATQKKERTVMLLHLKSGELGPTRPDVKIFPEVRDDDSE